MQEQNVCMVENDCCNLTVNIKLTTVTCTHLHHDHHNGDHDNIFLNHAHNARAFVSAFC